MEPVAGTFNSPVGLIGITMTEIGLAHLHFPGSDSLLDGPPSKGSVIDQLADYFAGALRQFTIPLDLTGLSDFTWRVLEATAEIPYGETRTYGEIARAIGRPGATQAVGNALGANPVAIVIPCHRVVRADGSMGWYTGGAEIKRALLGLEGVHFPQQRTLNV